MNEVLKFFETGNQDKLEPISIKELNGELVSTDGHTRGIAWHMMGYADVVVEWEDIEWDWDEYAIYVEWCKKIGITSIPDLEPRIIDHNEYEILWLERCRIMQEELESKRG